MKRRLWLILVALPLLALGLGAGLTGCSGSGVLNAWSGLPDLDGGAEIAETREVSYGPLPRHRYDLYDPGTEAAVIVFFHGGGWDRGDPDLYRFLGRRLAGLGHPVAIPAYRLAPEVAFPAFMEDAARAVAAIRARFPDRPLYLMGHSAGAQIATLLALDPRYLGAQGMAPCGTIAGVIGLAGPYDFLPLQEDRFRRVFPEATRPESQPVAYADNAAPPMLLLHGAADVVVHAEDSTILAEALRRAGNRAEAKLYPGVNHLDIIGAISPLIEHRAPTLADIEAFLAAEAARAHPGCPG